VSSGGVSEPFVFFLSFCRLSWEVPRKNYKKRKEKIGGEKAISNIKRGRGRGRKIDHQTESPRKD
jgi:hypothetical protein